MKSVRQKIIAGFSVILILLTIISVFSYIRVSQFNRDVNQALTHDMQVLSDYQALNFNIVNRVALARGYLLGGGPYLKELFFTYAQKSRTIEERLLSNTTDEKTQNLLKESREWEEFIEKEVFVAYETNNKELAIQLMNQQGGSYATALIEGFNGKITDTQSAVTKVKHTLIKNGSSLKLVILIISIAAIVLGIMISLFIARMVTNPIIKVVNQMKAVAQGDLRGQKLQVQSNDEVGQLSTSVNEMVDSLRSVIQKVNEASEQVAVASEGLTESAGQTSKATEHITCTMQEVAVGAENQVYSVEESAMAIKAMSESVQKISAHAQQVSETAVVTLEKSEEGNKVIQTAINQMTSMHQTVNGLEKDIRELAERSKEIGQITATITGIAEQTNLLALNAAIEAARAGEQGRGFAIVADEVRKLAEMSSKSSQQITGLVKRIQAETKQVIVTMKHTTTEVTEGITVVHTAGESFEQIKHSIEEVTSKIQQVSMTVQQMASGTEQVVYAVDMISQVSEETSYRTQDISSSAQEQLVSMEKIVASSVSLANMAEELQNLIRRFKT